MSKKDAYIIIDIGTGNVRVAVAGTDGNIFAVERDNIRYHRDDHYPEALFFDPDALWDQIVDLARTAMHNAGDVNIIALTATSQREGIVLIGKDGRSLIGLPNIDHRGREWEYIISNKSLVYQQTGRYPTSLFSALKLVGIRERRNDIWKDFSTFVSISDWAQYRLSGQVGFEHSQASETLLYDVEQKSWSENLCSIFGIDPAVLPAIVTSGTILGQVARAEAEKLSISPDAIVIVGGADTQLAVLGTQPATDDVVIVSGTTTPIIKVMSAYVTDEEERTWTGRHVDENSFMFEANAGVTGLNYQRLKDIFYPNEDYAVIEEELSQVTHFQCVAALGSLLADEKTPLTRGGFVFDTPVSHLLTRGSFVWATLWDIACSIYENYKTLCDVTHHHEDFVWACGGGLESKTLRQFVANLLGRKIVVRNQYRQSSVLGGVFICNSALGKTQPDLQIQDTVYPTEQAHYETLYQEWKNTRALFKKDLQLI